MITLEKAKIALTAAEAKAKELKSAVSIAIVDEHGTLVAFARMDGAITISQQFARTKAYTAGTTGMATQDIAPFATPGKPYYHIDTLFGGALTTMAGGLPIKENGKLIGGIGVGGSYNTDDDVLCAQAGLTAFK